MRRAAILAVLFAATCASAGGPAYVAGRSWFNPGLAGTPVRWAGTEVVYYTDQGDLNTLERQTGANALVAEAFSRWTGVPTAAISARRGGPLEQDVSGANVTSAGATLTMPADIQPNSTKAIAIVYDLDGKVTDALLGEGASKRCSDNFVFGGPDRFTPDGFIAHALVILNGTCIHGAGDIPYLRYQLIRAAGRVLGLDWTQANDNVAGGTPTATADDTAGFPAMHPKGSICAVAATGETTTPCATNSDQLRMDDRMAISALYPVTAANVGTFTGKKVFAQSAARIRGVVTAGNAPVQGVNVVARWVDPATKLATTKMVATSVSGFLFHGACGNPVTGTTNAAGERLDRWGSGDEQLRGYFELWVEIPDAGGTSKYVLTVEALNPEYGGALSVGPYKNGQISPPGMADPVVVTVTAAAELTQNIALNGATMSADDPYEPHSFAAPSAVPGAGHWGAMLLAHGDVDWHGFTIRAGRTFTLDVVALDDALQPASTKAQPVIGIWEAVQTASEGPALAQTYFNTTHAGVTRVQPALGAGAYKIGIADARGEGRADLRYRARLLYADTVTPDHAAPEGGTILAITGIGFASNVQAKVGGVEAPLAQFTPEKLMVVAPGLPDGTYALTLTDPETGATASVNNAVHYGGAVDDTLDLLVMPNPPVPVGTIAPYPFRVRVLNSSKLPVNGAAVRFRAPTGVLLLPCNTQDCTVGSDTTGEAMVWMVVQSAATFALSASLSGGASVMNSVTGIASSLAVVATPPKLFIGRNSAAAVPLLVRVVGSGIPLGGRVVEYDVMLGSATLSEATVTTDAAGEATTVLTIPNMSSEIRVSACVGTPPQTACDIFYVYAVTTTTGTKLVKAGGDEQYASPGKPFLPVTARVMDLSDPPNAVAGVAVKFFVTAYKQSDSARKLDGEVLSGRYAGIVAVGSEQATVFSNAWGVAPYLTKLTGPGLLIEIKAVTATQETTFHLHTWEH